MRRLLPLCFAAIAVLALLPALRAWPLFSSHYDWRYFEALTEISRRTVVFYHQVPLWNPYSCGGEVDLANPQSLEAAPTFLLVLLFGTAPGLKLSLCVYYFLGLCGAYLLARQLAQSVAAATLAALGFGLSGYLAQHLSSGHINFAGVSLYPWLLLSYQRARGALEYSVPLGLFATWVALLGGTFTPAMAGVLLVLWAGLDALWERSPRPFLPLLLAAPVALLCGAARMLPALEFVIDHPRRLLRGAPDRSWPWQVIGDLFVWRELAPVAGRKYWGHEYAARLPYLLAPLWLASPLLLTRRAGLPPVLRRRVAQLWAFAGIAALLCMGNFSPIAPWSLLQRLPVLRDLRVPSRHLVLLTLALPLLAGFTWDWLAARLGRRARILGVVLCALVAADGVAYTAWCFRDAFTVPLGRIIPRGPVPFYYVQGHWSTFREDVLAAHGTLGCDEEAPLQRAESLDVGPGPQARLLDPAAGAVVDERFTPDVRDVTVDLARPTVLLLNSNWNEHFRASPGRVVRLAGRLGVDLAGLPPGRHVISVRYHPRSFVIGAALSAVSLPLVLCVFLACRALRRRGLLGAG